VTQNTPPAALPAKRDLKALKAKSAARLARRAQRVKDNEALGAKTVKRGKKVPKAKRTKRLKKSGHVLWSLVVRNRDGNKCLMCGSVQYLNAHHWLFRKSHSVRLALDPANGATLCAYPCHLGRIHKDGDGLFMLQLAEKMTAIVGKLKVDEMIETGKHPSPVSEEELQQANDALEAMLGRSV
jgi:hypothetical protein